MGEILSQDEINNLLNEVIENSKTEESASGDKKDGSYDFNRQIKFTRDNFFVINTIHDIFAKRVAEYLSSRLKTAVKFEVCSIDQMSYNEFIRTISFPSMLSTINFTPLEGKIILEMYPPLARAMFAGKFDRSNHENREFTKAEIDFNRVIMTDCLTYLQEAWKKIIELNLKLDRMETDARRCDIAAPNETVVVITFECKLGSVEGMINLCIPYPSLRKVMNRLTSNYWHYGETVVNPAKEVSGKAGVPVTVSIGKAELPPEDVRKLNKGMILKLDKLTGDPVDIYAGNELVAKGEVIVIDECFGVRITENLHG